jgi:hypothetical protein
VDADSVLTIATELKDAQKLVEGGLTVCNVISPEKHNNDELCAADVRNYALYARAGMPTWD